MARLTTGIVAATVLAGTAHADFFDFAALQHGQIIQPATFGDVGMFIEATNFRLPGAMPIAFDTQFISQADPDLNGPPWAGGNLPINTVLGNVVIVPENLIDANNDGIVDNPDDEGARPAGDLIFRFAEPISSFGFDVIDIEGVVQERTTVDFLSGGMIVGTLDFMDLENPQSAFYDSTIEFGNNTLNRIQPVLAEGFGVESFDRVEIHLGGSGAFDNIVTTAIPSPASAALVGLGGMVMGRRRR